MAWSAGARAGIGLPIGGSSAVGFGGLLGTIVPAFSEVMMWVKVGG